MRRVLSFCSFNPVGKIQRQGNLRAAQNLGIAGKEEESVRKMVVEAGVGRVCRLEYESRAVAGGTIGAALSDFIGDEVRKDGREGRMCAQFRCTADSHEIGEKTRVEEKRQGFGKRRRIDGIDGLNQREFDAASEGALCLPKRNAQFAGEFFAVDGTAEATCENAKERHGVFTELAIAAPEKGDKFLGVDAPATVAFLRCESLHGRQTALEHAREQGSLVGAGKEG